MNRGRASDVTSASPDHGPTRAQATPLSELLGAVFELASDAITDELAQDQVPTWDSLRQLQLVATLEEVYRVRLSTREIMMLRSVGDIRAVLRDRGVPL